MKTGISMAAAGWQRQSPALRESKKHKVRQIRLIRINIYFICYRMGVQQSQSSLRIQNQFRFPTSFFPPELLIRVTA